MFHVSVYVSVCICICVCVSVCMCTDTRVLRGSAGIRTCRKSSSFYPKPVANILPRLQGQSTVGYHAAGTASDGARHVQLSATMSARSDFGHLMSNVFGPACFCNEKNMLLLMDNNF